MNTEIGLPEVVDIITVINNYSQLANSIMQLDPKQADTMKLWYDKMFPKGYMDNSAYQMWKNIDLHVVQQTWSNTSAGWEGIGGAAMTTTYTTVIENYNLGAAFVYYGSTLAYIALMDDKYVECLVGEGRIARYKDYAALPGMIDCSRKLNLIYIKKWK